MKVKVSEIANFVVTGFNELAPLRLVASYSMPARSGSASPGRGYGRCSTRCASASLAGTASSQSVRSGIRLEVKFFGRL